MGEFTPDLGAFWNFWASLSPSPRKKEAEKELDNVLAENKEKTRKRKRITLSSTAEFLQYHNSIEANFFHLSSLPIDSKRDLLGAKITEDNCVDLQHYYQKKYEGSDKISTYIAYLSYIQKAFRIAVALTNPPSDDTLLDNEMKYLTQKGGILSLLSARTIKLIVNYIAGIKTANYTHTFTAALSSFLKHFVCDFPSYYQTTISCDQLKEENIFAWRYLQEASR